jgi:hypothetical protein
MIDMGEYKDMEIDEYLDLPGTYRDCKHFIECLVNVYAYRHGAVRISLTAMVLKPLLKLIYPTVFTKNERVTKFWFQLISNRLNEAAVGIEAKIQFKVNDDKQWEPTLNMKYQPTAFIARGEFALAEILDI